jgi:hypothetical protein
MAKDHPDTGKTLGSAACGLCKARVLVKVSRRGLPYYNCDTTDGGCGSQTMPRTADSAKHLAAQIDKWNDPAQRRAFLGDAALPAKARKKDDAPADPPADPVDQDDDAPADPPADPVDQGDDAPADPPPPPRAKPKRAAPKRTPPPVKPAVRLFGKWS